MQCRENYGVSKVFVSSILPRASCEFQGNKYRMNCILSDLCAQNDLIFIDNSDIILNDHIGRDGVHMNREGGSLLTGNILNCLNA